MSPTVYTERRENMSNPNIPSANTQRNRNLFRTLYRVAMIAYWLILLVISYVSSILDNNSFLWDLDLWGCFQILLFISFPFYACVATSGQLALFLISDKTVQLPPQKYKLQLGLRITAIVVSVIALLGINVILSL